MGRYYAPFVGQYLSLDPRWLDHLDTHPYSYARSDPYGRHDPLGDIAPLIIAIGGAALVGGVVNAGVTAWQGGSWRQIGASFAHGALSGAGAATGPLLGGLAGGPGGAIAGGMAGAGLGGFLGTLTEQAINGQELCFGCAAKAALLDGLFAGLFSGLGKMLGKALANTALGRAVINSRIGQAISRAVNKALASAKSALRRVRISVSPTYRNFLNSVEDFKNGQNPELADPAYSLWRQKKWAEHEKHMSTEVDGKPINGGWPPNNGAVKEVDYVLKKGETFDRYGGWYDEDGNFHDSGKFGSPTDVGYSDRALAPGSDARPKHTYELMLRSLG